MRLLVPVDGSPFGALAADFITARAATLDEGPFVELLHVQARLPAEARKALGGDAVGRYHGRISAAVMKPLARSLEAAGLHPRRRTEFGAPAERITARAEVMKADLIVMGSHGRSALGELVFGSVAQGVLARSQKPLLILRGPNAPLERALRVGVAIDGSAASKAALEAVLDHRAVMGEVASLTLIHVQEVPLVLIDPASGVALPTTLLPDPATARRRLARFLRMAARAGVPAKLEVLLGPPGDTIAKYARRNLDVLALGATGRSRLSRVFLGSVAARVAARCEVPLLLAHGPRGEHRGRRA